MPNPSKTYPYRSGRSFGDSRFSTPARSATPPPDAQEKKPRQPLKIVGDAAAWVVIQHAKDPNTGWIKTTRAMPVGSGLVIHTSASKSGMAVCSEATCFVPGATLVTVGNVTSVK